MNYSAYFQPDTVTLTDIKPINLIETYTVNGKMNNVPNIRKNENI